MSEPSQLTLMAVHAHPDDEASSTGGILAQYSAEGVQTIVVTCTNGELGDAPGGIKPDEAGFDEELVVATRREELAESCRILGVSHLEMLGYHDSGMMGWPSNDDPRAFWQMPVEKAAEPLVALIEQYRPQILVTYDANGFYGHPDHIQAHRITVSAAKTTGIASKLYFPAFAKSRFQLFAEALAAAGIEDGPRDDEDGERDFGVPDDQISAIIDCTAFVDRKRAALEAHRSQTDSTFFMKIPVDLFDRLFAQESFVKEFDITDSGNSEVDLFTGLR